MIRGLFARIRGGSTPPAGPWREAPPDRMPGAFLRTAERKSQQSVSIPVLPLRIRNEVLQNMAQAGSSKIRGSGEKRA